MPQVKQYTLLEEVTTNGDGTAVDVRNVLAMSVYVAAVGGTSADISFEGTADPVGADGWKALAFREAGGGAYAVTAVSVAADTGRSFYFDPADNVNWIRVVVANQAGPTSLSAYLTGEL